MCEPSDSPTSAQQHVRRYGSADQGLVHRLEARAVLALLSRIGPSPRAVLDAPCGYGRWAALVQDTLAPERLVGADRNPARLTAYGALPSALAVQADLLSRLPFGDGVFDLAVSLRFLQHLRLPAERVAALRELRRVSRGHLLVSYYRAGGLHGLQRRLLPRYRKRPLAHLTPTGFAREAFEGGWELIEDRPVWWGIHAQSIALLRSRS